MPNTQNNLYQPPIGTNHSQISTNNIAQALNSINQMNHNNNNYFSNQRLENSSNPRQENSTNPSKLDYNRIATTESTRNYQTSQQVQNIYNPPQEPFYNSQYTIGTKSPSNLQKLQPATVGQITKENVYKSTQNGRPDTSNVYNDSNARKKDLNIMTGTAIADINYNKIKYQPNTSPNIPTNINQGSSNLGGANHPVGITSTKMFNANTHYGNAYQGTIPKSQILPETTSASNLNKNVPYSSNKYMPTNNQPGLGGIHKTGYKFNKD